MNAETPTHLIAPLINCPLQWGRVLMNAETTHLVSSPSPTFYASMGPRSHERGNKVAWANNAAITLLQWGRVLMNAETDLDYQRRQALKALQWGRVLMNAETSVGE